jgi:uncharacterized protein (DUF488 family)
MSKDSGTFTTIGYQGAPTDAVFAALTDAKVELLVDVRAIAGSRKPGFSKTPFAAGLQEHGIGYVHLKGLGTPREGRLAARSGNRAEFDRIFSEHMQTDVAQRDLAGLLDLMKSGRRVCLMCFEHDPAHCHRTIVAETVEERTGIPFVHLFPKTVTA